MRIVKTLMSDTSVLIDLDRDALVAATFCPPFEFTVPDLPTEREFREHEGPKFVRMGIRVEGPDCDGFVLARRYLHKRKSPSRSDCFALALAKTNSWTLQTGDRDLRELAEQGPCPGPEEGGEHRSSGRDIRKRMPGHTPCELWS